VRIHANPPPVGRCAICKETGGSFWPMTWGIVTEFACLRCALWCWLVQKAHGMRIA
jgi:hypothetical protein